MQIHGLQHVGFLVESLETALSFYQGILGLELNHGRPADRLPYRGAWLMVRLFTCAGCLLLLLLLTSVLRSCGCMQVGPDMIHLMELPDPDTKTVGCWRLHLSRLPTEAEAPHPVW